jgi:branched-chain amino acid transport system substrate-binding protein
MQRRQLMALAVLAAAIAAPAFSQSKEMKIAHIYSKTGPLEAYGKQTTTGFMHGPGLRHRRHHDGGGKKLVVIEKDDQGKPDVGKSRLAAAYGDDKADIAVGPTASSGVALAMLPVAEEYKKMLLVEPAVADSITGDKWNKYIFRTGRNSSQDAAANAAALDKAGTVHRHAGPGLRLRPRRRQGLQGIRWRDQESQGRARGIPAATTTDFTAGRSA